LDFYQIMNSDSTFYRLELTSVYKYEIIELCNKTEILIDKKLYTLDRN
jgi:hypothetical protein